MFIFTLIVIAILVGAWAGIMFDAWLADANLGGETDSFGYYAKVPWTFTAKNFWELLGTEVE